MTEKFSDKFSESYSDEYNFFQWATQNMLYPFSARLTAERVEVYYNNNNNNNKNNIINIMTIIFITTKLFIV